MSFIELFGGSWTIKEAPSAEVLEKRQQLMTKLQYSAAYIEKLATFFGGGNVASPTFIIKEEGEGVYGATLEMGELTQTVKFTLDGSATESERILDGKKITQVCQFADGVWTATLSTEGCPDTLHVRKIVGDEMHSKDTCEDLVIEDVFVKA